MHEPERGSDDMLMDIDGIEIAFERRGTGPPLLLLTGLGGVGRAWGSHIQRFADMAGLVRHSGLGPAHVVGSSTGGAIAQVMALDHPDTVASLTLVSSWAGPDPYFSNQFAMRRSVLLDQGVLAYTRCSSLFLFAPSFAAANPHAVEAWIERASAHPGDPDIMSQRIDMILDHDQRDRLATVSVPTLVIEEA